MVRQVEAGDTYDDGSPYTMEAQYETPCPDGCGYMIEEGDPITPNSEGEGWVLAEHQWW